MTAQSDKPDGAVQVPLDASDRAPGQARRATREVLTGWRLPALVDRVVLVVSELVTNAVRYGRPPVSLELRRVDGGVDVRVHDADPVGPPAIDGDEAPADAESGRGLGIVSALATDVAYEQVPGDGKVVQASFDTDD